MRASRKEGSRRAAFTLIEMLVSVAVLGLLILLVIQLLNSTSALVTGGREHMSADSQARAVFDRMGGDFEKMAKRTDVDYVFWKQSGNDAMFFYSEAPAYLDSGTSGSTMGLIGYRINSNFQLERLGKSLNWDGPPGSTGGGMVFLTYPAGSGTPNGASLIPGAWPATVGSAPYTNGSDADYHVLASGVFRMEICFQRTDGKYYNSPSANAPSTYSADGNVYGFPPDLSAIVVALGILDDTSRTIVSNMAGVAPSLPDSVDASVAPSMAQAWNNVVTSGSLAAAGVPRAAAAQLRVYQRTFFLNSK